MSYPKDLDEYTDLAIRREWQRRNNLIILNKCTYCEEPPNKCNCKMKNVVGMVKDFVFIGTEEDARTF